MKRILTLQIEIENLKQASWIWNSHQHNCAINGVHVQVIQNGEIEKDDAFIQEHALEMMRKKVHGKV